MPMKPTGAGVIRLRPLQDADVDPAAALFNARPNDATLNDAPTP